MLVRESQTGGDKPRESAIDYVTERGHAQTRFGSIPKGKPRFWLEYPDVGTGRRIRETFDSLRDSTTS